MTTTFLLIPGAGGDAWYWHRLVPELERRGHRAVAVGLPSGDDDAGLAAYADAVHAAAGDAAPLVVVAQSMGGLTAPLVCGAAAGGAAGAGQRDGAAAWRDRRGLVGGHGRRAGAGRGGGAGRPRALDDDTDFFHDVPDDVVAAAMQRPFEQSGRPFEDPWPLSHWPDVPTRVVAGRDDRFFPIGFQRRVAEERLGLPVDEVPGGHLVALSRPSELADLLESYLGSSQATPLSRSMRL